MRKLTVKNFSVIKEAELEFGKITVLIGPQSSGKSLLCKLAYFFEQVMPERINDSMGRKLQLLQLVSVLRSDFDTWFPSESWRGQQFTIFYGESEKFSFEVSVNEASDTLTFVFDNEFVERYRRWIQGSGVVFPSEPESRDKEGPLFINDVVYIPSGRTFFSTPNRAISVLSAKNLDPVTQQFAQQLDMDYRRLRGDSHPVLPVMSDFLDETLKILDGELVRENEEIRFQFRDNPRKTSLSLLSSGTLELLPLFNAFSRFVERAKYLDIPTMPEPRPALIFIEEPELSVFPKTQYLLVRLFAWLTSRPLNLSLVITTHSPYTLSSFNNLIEAGQVVYEHPELRDGVTKVVPEKYWVKGEDFRAYAIEDGVLKSIVAEDTHLISGNYLDSVSETIGAEFDELLRLGYVEA